MEEELFHVRFGLLHCDSTYAFFGFPSLGISVFSVLDVDSDLRLS